MLEGEYGFEELEVDGALSGGREAVFYCVSDAGVMLTAPSVTFLALSVAEVLRRLAAVGTSG